MTRCTGQNFNTFSDVAKELIAYNGLDTPHAARALALMSVAQADAVIAVWDVKYAYARLSVEPLPHFGPYLYTCH